MARGYYGIGVYHPKNILNIGSLFRTAQILDASFIFTIGRRYRGQPSDTQKSWRHVPLYYLAAFEEFEKWRPYDCQLVGVEMGNGSTDISEFKHPQRAIYLLGAEDHGIPGDVLKKCNHRIKLRGDRSLNLAVAGSIVLYHRVGLNG